MPKYKHIKICIKVRSDTSRGAPRAIGYVTWCATDANVDRGDVRRCDKHGKSQRHSNDLE
eukprot:scaffold60117_cov37-Attheya_sp.AAC.1